MLKWLAVIAFATGCTGDDTEEWYGGADNGSTWHVTLSPGTPISMSVACPTIAPIRIALPSNSCSSACGSGEACALTFNIDDSGDVIHDYSVTTDFSDDCGSGALTCSGGDVKNDPKVSCEFSAARDCDYTGTLVRVE